MHFTPPSPGPPPALAASLRPSGLCPPLLSHCLLHTHLSDGVEEQRGASAEPEGGSRKLPAGIPHAGIGLCWVPGLVGFEPVDQRLLSAALNKSILYFNLLKNI